MEPVADLWADHAQPEIDGLLLHATTVALNHCALVIAGPSGSGKSRLALALMGYGCDLVADDRTWLHKGKSGLIASAPSSIAGQIEARGIGLLRAKYVSAPVVWALELTDRPQPRLGTSSHIRLLSRKVAFHRVESHAALAPSIFQLMKSRPDDTPT